MSMSNEPTCTVPKFSETNLNHLPCISLKIHNLCKIIRNNFKNPNFFQRFLWGMRIPLWSLYNSQPSFGRRFPLPATPPSQPPNPKTTTHLHITTTKLRDSCGELTSKTCRCRLQVSMVAEVYPQMVGKKNKTNTWLEIHHQNDITCSSCFWGIPIYKHIHFVTSIVGGE